MKKDLSEQANEILKAAEEYGLQGNFLFQTTFQRYIVQLNILNDLDKARKEHGATVTKEYVKGRKNVVANPAVSEYNKTSTAANNTVSTLMKIIDNLKEDDEDAAKELMEYIQGRK